ncbi:Conserved_hypothetical protein [Hexamita inflata]|uniref:Uncharacterized protein n=1 Tax=Hexamita inflata TaxID=28002 RepID=A0AA86US70_9EUKA|nr:Conserved hypothetical protein [Hexamita inflata]CAI9962621.1 Conserved hypothetical protein [Hexamita inflata]
MFFRHHFWLVSIYEYKYDTDGDKYIQMVSRCCMYLNYMSLSSYIQTWLKVLMAVYRYQGEKAIRISFSIIDSLVTLVFLTAVISRPFIAYQSTLFQDLNVFIAGFFGFLALIYLIMGSLLLHSLRQFYQCISRPVISFFTISVLFCLVSVMRISCILWSQLTDARLNSNCFVTLCIFIPDTIPCCVFFYSQYLIIKEGEVKRKSIRDGETESMIIKSPYV